MPRMDEPPADPADAEETGPAHRDPSASLITRLGRTRLTVLGLVAVLFLGGAAALAAGLGPGDGLGGSGPTDRDVVPIVSAPDAPEETEDAAPVDPDSTIGLSYLGLCRAFQTELATNDAAAADPAFDDLADDAGGESKIEDYCVELLGEASATATATPTATPTSQPTPTRQPGTSPRPRPTTTPTATVTPTPSPTPTATTPGPPDPTVTPTGPGGKPTKTPRN